MDVNALLSALGYLSSDRHWVTPENADPRLTHYYRLAQRAGDDAGDGAAVVGSYVYTTSLEDRVTPPRPAVFVSYARDEEQARSIHRHFWNMGDCPFVVVVLPGSIRVYTGFDYSHNYPKRALIVDEPVSLLDDDLPESLRPFHAQAIDNGSIWDQQARHLKSDTRVDYRLLANLKELSLRLQDNFGLARPVAHALIGKYIYFRYLRDRAILDDGWLATQNLRPEDIFGRDATAAGFETLTQALQIQFNGAIFPLPSEDDGRWRTNDSIRFLAATFHGDSFDGQLVLDFGAYDFSYIPVELLSSVYEQFLKAEGKGQGDGVVYTPEALADYVLSEVEIVRPLELTHKVLDPCCGSGVFLVLAYRRLIEKQWREQGARPSAQELKRLLQASIFGIEKDPEACDITAFSLILTLLSHLDPPELHTNADFQFPTLVGENIYCTDFFNSDCRIFQEGAQFDWVIGNPPWTGADAKNPDHGAALTWMREAAKDGRKVGGLRLDEAFTWRAGDVLKEGGCAGLLVMATSLVNSSSSGFRKGFFRTFQVRRITNLSNFLRILFMGPQGKRAEAPAACLIYEKVAGEPRKQPILHFGPFVTNQVPLSTTGGHRRVWTIMIYQGDVQNIEYEAAIEDEPCLWKTALYGGYQDRRTLRRLRLLLPHRIQDVAKLRGWLLSDAPLIRSLENKSKDKFVAAPALAGQSILDTQLLKTRFAVTNDALILLEPERQFIGKRIGHQGLGLIQAPHILITAEVAVYSDLDFAMATPKVGIAARREDSDYLKATALFLNSSVVRYVHFFLNAPWGISKDKVMSGTVGAIPFAELSAEQIEKMAAVYDTLAAREIAHLSAHAPLQAPLLNLQSEVDTAVESAMGIPDSIGFIAREFMQVRYQLIKGKIGETANKPPSLDDLTQYAEQLRIQMDDFAQRSHRITVEAGPDAIMATVEVTRASEPIQVSVTQNWNTTARNILAAVEEQHSQWSYVQRSVRIFDGPCVHIIKTARLLDWTRTQALQDTADIIAEVLDKTTPRHASASA